MKQGDVTTQDEATLLPVPYVGRFARVMNVATGSVGYTGVGFRPRLLLFVSPSGGINGGSWGHATAADQGGQYDNNAATANDFAQMAVTSCIRAVESGTANYAGKLASMDIDGFTIDWTRTGATTGNTLSNEFVAFK